MMLKMPAISVTFLQRHRLNITVILLFLALTLIFTFPLILHISEATPFADGSGDQFQSMWLWWSFKTSLLELNTNFLHTDFAYYPQGTSLTYHTSVFLGLLALPFQYLAETPKSLIISHNLLMILTFVLSGFGMYLLVWRLVKHPVIAFICGLLFAFCPYRLWHMNHLNLLSTQWIPFYILYLVESVDRKSLKSSLWAAAFFILTFLSSLTYASFLALFTLFYVAYLLIRSRKVLLNKRVISNLSIALLMVCVLLSPLLYSLYSTRIDWAPSEEMVVRTSANLLGYFLPVKERSLLGSYFLPSLLNFRGIAGGEIFLGYVLLFFAVYTWIRRPPRKAKFWFFSSLAFLLLSLGQAIHVYGHSLHFKWLPYGILRACIPVFQVGRTPGRFSIMVTLCLIAFSSYGWARLLRQSGAKKVDFSRVRNFFRGFLTRRGAPIVIVVLVCLEFIVFPTELIRVEIPKCYDRVRNARGDFAVIELPHTCTGPSLMCNARMLYQTYHGKRVVNGYLSRPSHYSKDFLNRVIFEQEKTEPGKIHYGVDREKLAANNVKFVIMHETELPWPSIRRPPWTEIQNLGCAVIEEGPATVEVIELF
jgi:hypothetical protein